MSFVLATMADKQARHYLRQGSTSKKPLKEKLVQIYEAYFRGEDPSLGNPGFWDELFLLKVNANFIESELEKLSADQLHGLKENINTLFYKCVATLREDYQIRIVHALQTLCALIRGVYRRDLANYGFDVIDVLVGFDSAENLMQTLIEHVNSFLVTECPVGLRSLSLKLLLALATATDNVSQNTILEYLMMNSIFESIIHLLANPTDRQHHGEDIVLLLAILVNYRKYESANPYIVKLSILDDELALNGLGQVVSNILSDFNREFAMRQPDQQQQGFFSTITSMVGGMLLAEENGNGGQSHLVRANHGILLALYEAVHLNRNFVTALTHSHTIMETSPPHSPVALNPPLDLSAESQSSNLLVTFLQYSSIVFQDVKDESKQCNAKLCLIIMTCIAEDQYANSLMHDANMNFRVQLHKMPMRHRKPKPEKAVPSRPLACALLDLMVEFVMSHMMKNLPMELYLKCLGITHRVLCYQKRCRVRLNYTWKELWTALISLLKFLLAQESSLLPQYNIFQLASQVVNIFNLFITYGDTFLPSPTSYDELYYEVVRMHQVFDNLYSMALRYTSTEGEYKEVASRLTNSLVNIRAIINHFNPKIDSWAAVNHLSALTEEQVLEVVRGNYDTLTLKLHDSLDLFERYSEKPKESSFFTQLVRSVIQDVRTHVATTAVTQERVLQEFSSIS